MLSTLRSPFILYNLHMTILYVTDANTGELVPIDTTNPSGILCVLDYNTGDPVPVNLSSPSGNLNVIDANTGEITELDLSNLSGNICVLDSNTGNIVEIDLSSPSGLLYVHDDNTGSDVQLNLNAERFINSRGMVFPLNNPEYFQKVLALEPIAYWPLWEAAGATTVDDLRELSNGVPYNITFGVTGIGDRRTAASFNGTTSRINVYSAALAAAFNGTAGTFFCWAKVSTPGVWTDATYRNIFYFAVNTNNRVSIRRTNVNNEIMFLYVAGGTLKSVLLSGQSSTNFIPFAITWDKVANQMMAYANGIQVGLTQTGLGTWAGSLYSDNTVIGSSAVATPAQVWSGNIAHIALWTKALTPTQILRLSGGWLTDLYFMGDSRSVIGNSWQNELMMDLGFSGDWTAGQGWGASTLRTNVEATSNFGSRVLLNIGSVDLLSLPNESIWITDILATIDKIHEWKADVPIYLAKPWRLTFDNEADILAERIDIVTTLRNNVFTGHDERVWLKGDDNGATMSSDGIHYSVAGQLECEAQWKTVLGY